MNDILSFRNYWNYPESGSFTKNRWGDIIVLESFQPFGLFNEAF